MRVENLLHAATAVVVRDGAGRVYVHRRTPIKDVYPGRRDFASGGWSAPARIPTPSPSVSWPRNSALR
jgi:hypothetical protein